MRLALGLVVFGLWVTPVVAQVEVLEKELLAQCVDSNAQVRKLAGEMKFTEGPTWIGGKGGYLVFSDIPGNVIRKWDGKTLSIFREPSHNTNGNTTDSHGRLLSAEHSARRISVTPNPLEKPNETSVVVDQFEGRKFNSPNDVVVRSDGTIWFTDPPYGIPQGQKQELDGNYVFRHDPAANKTTIVSKEHDRPNGLAFSPDEKTLYVADSGKPHHIRAYAVQAEGDLAPSRVFCTISPGGPDGIRTDTLGNVWSSAGDGVHIFSPAGTLLGKIRCPETPANLCFGLSDNTPTLFMTSRTSLYAVPIQVVAPEVITDRPSPR